MLKRLKQDHKNISVLLNILAAQSSKLVAGESLNYRIIMDVLEYMQSYAEHSHHPVEDIVYRYLQQHSQLTTLSDRMAKEHEHLSRVTAEFHSTLSMVLADHPVSRETLQSQLESYVMQQRAHMQYEEEEVFPLAQQYIDEQGWDRIADMCQQLTDDPLFSDKVGKECHELRALVRESELV